MDSIDFDHIQEYKRNVSLLFDEMKSGLVFCSTTGKLVGLCEMGDVNDALAEFARKCENGDSTASSDPDRQVAQYVIVFMVRRIYSPLCKAIGHCVSSGFTSDQIYPCAWGSYQDTRINWLESMSNCC